MTEDIIALATKYGRYDYRKITALLNDQKGWRVNHKRVERIWRREGLKVPKKQSKRGRLWLNDGSCVRLRQEYQDHVWSYDFMIDRTADGRAFKILVNSQRKWATSGKKDDGYLEACSCFPGEVKYRLRKEQDHDSRNNR